MRRFRRFRDEIVADYRHGGIRCFFAPRPGKGYRRKAVREIFEEEKERRRARQMKISKSERGEERAKGEPDRAREAAAIEDGKRDGEAGGRGITVDTVPGMETDKKVNKSPMDGGIQMHMSIDIGIDTGLQSPKTKARTPKIFTCTDTTELVAGTDTATIHTANRSAIAESMNSPDMLHATRSK
ncbi:MAG: hypothetical protein M1826_001780 [Phylliscum demangeonii]|nr:MAG: hypothetical protein M1826_001780 [Phylliscum demangeonii]